MGVSNLTTALYKHSALFFGLFLLASPIAFWPRYFSDVSAVPSLAVHLHGWLMAAWLVMLVSQAFLIRLGRRATHRAFGKLSYGLAPAVAASIVFAAHVSVNRGAITELRAAQLALQLGYVPLFLAVYGLAMRNRHDPPRHARFMVCTVLPATSPVFDRILGFYFMPRMAFLPQFVDGSRLLPLIYVVLVSLGVWDWRTQGRAGVFAIVAVFFFLQHATVLMIYQSQGWQAFAGWFARLPLT